MKLSKKALIAICRVAKYGICEYDSSPYICVNLFRIELSNSKYGRECRYLTNKIHSRLEKKSTAELWLYGKIGEWPNPKLMRKWRGQWLDMLIAEIEQHGRLL